MSTREREREDLNKEAAGPEGNINHYRELCRNVVEYIFVTYCDLLCLETYICLQKARDECIAQNGPESETCQELIEAHKQCLRKEGFNV